MLNRKKILVLLPAFNEEEGLQAVFKKMPKYVDTVVVVDNNSTDSTAKVAKKNKAIVLSEKRQGKGYAFQTFKEFLNSKKIDHDYVVMLDADNTYAPEEVSLMVGPLNQGYDVVVGTRINPKRQFRAMRGLNLFGNRMLTTIANILYFNFKVNDICCGYWAFKTEKLKDLKIRAKGFDLEADLYSQSTKSGCKMDVVPIFYGMRLGIEKLKVRHGLLILKRLVYNRFF
ncbi:MAG: glycosyltransferase [Candidatus Diapherotrites archaeon]|nr:glycosyltransferase [Candidatus Diapherotrites archaeon]